MKQIDIKLQFHTEHEIEILAAIQKNITYKVTTCDLPLNIIALGSVNLDVHNWNYALKLMSLFGKQDTNDDLFQH